MRGSFQERRAAVLCLVDISGGLGLCWELGGLRAPWRIVVTGGQPAPVYGR
jgi:hypothetical protein